LRKRHHYTLRTSSQKNNKNSHLDRQTPELRIEFPSNGLIKEITHSDAGRVYNNGGKIFVPGRSVTRHYGGPWTITTHRPINVRLLSDQRVCLQLFTWTCGDTIVLVRRLVYKTVLSALFKENQQIWALSSIRYFVCSEFHY
jgi:hypothetical protein